MSPTAGLAGARRRAVDMDRAGAALRHAAAKFRSGQADDIADRPKQGHFGIDVERARFAIEGKSDHGLLSSCFRWLSRIVSLAGNRRYSN